jgi:hypothetical protein
MKDWIKLSGLNESKESDFQEFSKKRYAGAKKIVENAEEKGGPALLTRDHFAVKLPYYQEAEAGNFDKDEMKKEYQELCTNLHSKMQKIETVNMKEFQELLGKLEVVGELLIKNHNLNT